MLKIDLHLHTAEDPVDPITHDAWSLVDRAADQGYGALAITLHDRQLSDPGLREYARDRGVVLLPGIEKTVSGKHVLLINFPAAAEQVETFADLAALKRRSGGLVVAPHPFFPAASCVGSRLEEDPDLFDAVEWSWFWTRGLNFNARAARWAAARGKPLIGNSDLHDLRQLGRTYSIVDAAPEPGAICEAIRRGRVALRTEPVSPLGLARVLQGMLLRGWAAALTPGAALTATAGTASAGPASAIEPATPTR
jgi:predicted metal-dependent phosphoesterase TrpH